MTGPLHGVRIIMMGGLGPAPLCGMLLGDLGAEVIRIDALAGVDAPLPVDYTVRRSQRSLAADVKDPRGRELVRRLAADADAFVDVYRPGVAERLGVGPEVLRELNPRLVYARMTGYGQDGPLAGHAGHDINYLALTGALHAIGTAETPVPPLNLVGDYGGGAMLLAVGLLSAILEARASGAGQVLDVAMVDGVAALLAPYFGMLRAGTWRDRRQDNLLDGAAHFYGAYATADGGHIAVGAMEPKFYAELCDRLDVDVPHDEDDPDAWAGHRAALAARFAEKPRAEWERLLDTPGCCATPVLSLTEAPRHPHNVARQTFVELDGVTQPAPAPRFSRTRPVTPAPPSLPGDHTRAVLRELGLDADAITALEHAGVVAQSSAN
ncbi:alpha-methylacyl-CoA racemase [Mycobacterium mantenii]|uniref:Alpha-methylacyl-CoA racemase n=1 Tax=Mycobacterium mantenii TaxID=560555 RepID=A0A1X0G406_MYCNT|nr:CaiB/BaiF CoA-transferase family protein [Mycobacterium mantenii]MCV7243785.1 CoA transferase [Mycobacterium mantenii]ORB08761.1 carnitine dehydratase [Mycobacterium mantenii]BBY41625.1 alpha-methylacyl-CoA racemase [Mycobacterium mantenii]